MYEELLIEIGLTKSETAVYFALLKLGSSTTGPIIKEAKIASGKAYIILDKLLGKGLVTYTLMSGTKHYQAKDPERLLDYISEKKSELQNKEQQVKAIIPELKQEYLQAKNRQVSEIFEGVKGFKTFYEFTLKELKHGDCIDIMGVPRKAHEKFEAYLLDWNKRRIDLGIKMRIIYNLDCKEFSVKRKKMKLTEIRYMKKDLETPVWIDIFKDYVVTINVHGDPMVFLIHDKKSAEAYEKYFELIWKQSDK